MENITKYIEEIRLYINNNPGITQDELVRYVCIDLGKRLAFNLQFIPFGTSRTRRKIYGEVNNLNKVDECLGTNTVICNTASKILCFVLQPFGIDIRTATDQNDSITTPTPHVFNIVRRDSGEEYIVDLQGDMSYIQMHARTPNYGISVTDGTRVIPYTEQERMDRKIGYISDDDYYTDEYLYTLKMDVDCMDSLYDKVKHILGNIEVYDNPNACYIVRQWYHVSVLEFFFNQAIFDYRNGSGKIRVINGYKNLENGSIIYVNCIVLEDRGETHIFLYNTSKGGYSEIEIDNFIQALNNGLVLRNQKIYEVEQRLKKARFEKLVKR